MLLTKAFLWQAERVQRWFVGAQDISLFPRGNLELKNARAYSTGVAIYNHESLFRCIEMWYNLFK